MVPLLSIIIQSSARSSILLRVTASFSTVSNISSSSPLARMRSIAISGSTSTKTFTSGMGRMTAMSA